MDVNYLIEKDIIAKLKLAIQDVDTIYRLRLSLPLQCAQQIKRLRGECNYDSHYIRNDNNCRDSQELISYKIQRIKEKLKNMPSSTRSDLGQELCT